MPTTFGRLGQGLFAARSSRLVDDKQVIANDVVIVLIALFEPRPGVRDCSHLFVENLKAQALRFLDVCDRTGEPHFKVPDLAINSSPVS